MQAQLIKTYRGHTKRINALVALNRKYFVISASEDHTIKVWNLATDEPMYTLRGHRSPAVLAAFPSGDFIVSGGGDARIKMWNTETGEIIRNIGQHDTAVTALAVAGNGYKIVSGSADGVLAVWDSIDGEQLFNIQAHANPINALAVSINNQYILSGELIATNGSSVIKMWDLKTGEHIRDFHDAQDGIHHARFLIDDEQVITGSSDGKVRLWNWQTGKTVKTLETHSGTIVMTVMPDGRFAVVGNQHPSLALLNLGDSDEHLFQLAEPSNRVSAATVTSDGQQIVVGCDDGMMHVYELWD